MRSRILALAGVLAFSGCIIVGDEDVHEALYDGDITFEWSFNVCDASDVCVIKGCAGVPEVKAIRIRIANEVLSQDTFFCKPYGTTEAITLQAFRGGSYTYDIEGLDDAEQVVYAHSGGHVTVNGDVVVPVVLDKVDRYGSLDVHWTFGPLDKSCATARIDQPGAIDTVWVKVNDETDFAWACSAGLTISDLNPGTNNVTVWGAINVGTVESPSWQDWYRGTRTPSVVAGTNPTRVDIRLDPIAAGSTFVPANNVGVAYSTCPVIDGVGTINLFTAELKGPGDTLWTTLSPAVCSTVVPSFVSSYLLADQRQTQTPFESTYQIRIKGCIDHAGNCPLDSGVADVVVQAGLKAADQKKNISML